MTPEEIEEEIAKRPGLSAHNRSVLRDMLRKGSMEERNDAWWERYSALEEIPTNNNYHDDI